MLICISLLTTYMQVTIFVFSLLPPEERNLRIDRGASEAGVIWTKEIKDGINHLIKRSVLNNLFISLNFPLM